MTLDDARRLLLLKAFEWPRGRAGRFRLQGLLLHEDTQAPFSGAFLKASLCSLAFDRGFGTGFTQTHWPQAHTKSYRWPRDVWRLHLNDFVAGPARHPVPGCTRAFRAGAVTRP